MRCFAILVSARALLVVCLIWISWNVNAAFFGGALATETDLAVRPPRAPT